MRSAESWHHYWAADHYHDPRLIDMIRATQADALETAAKVCREHEVRARALHNRSNDDGDHGAACAYLEAALSIEELIPKREGEA